MHGPLRLLSESGISIWLDDLSRERFSGGLEELIATMHVVGVTTNPAIFSAAITKSDLYRHDIDELSAKGLDQHQIVRHLTTADVGRACDIFHPVYVTTQGVDGRVSIEVDPELARDTERTIEQGISLWDEISRPNLLIKVPATQEGLLAIEELTAHGISVNVTLIFTPGRYEEVIDAYLKGLERRVALGERIDSIHSVASFFVSRIDTEIDRRLKMSLSEQEFESLRGRAGIANAINAYEIFLNHRKSERWQKLERSGARVQRPLWASTGVKDPAYSPTLYVDQLATPDSVNTMPENTLLAASRIEGGIDLLVEGSARFDSAREHMSRLSDLGIEIEEVGALLEAEGLEKFVTPWRDLHEQVRGIIGG